MPTLIINTNTPGSKVPQGFLNEATNVVAEMLGKPASFVAVRVHTDQVMSFGGTQDPCATVDLMCIGKMGPDVNDQHTVTIGNFIQSKLCIPLNRMAASIMGGNWAESGETCYRPQVARPFIVRPETKPVRL